MRLPTFTPASLPLTAHGIKRTGPAKVSGAHLSDAANEPEPMECGDLSESDLAEIDAAYHQKKVSGGLRKRDDRDAAKADLAWLDVLRRGAAL